MNRRIFSLTMFWLSVAAVAITATATVNAQSQVGSWLQEWPNTDFSLHSVELDEIMSGGPPRDGIPAIDAPQFIAVSEETRLGAREPVMTLELDGSVPRAYPLRYLLWHEIVNDVVGGIPVAVTYCPLCNSGITFDRRVDEAELTFGVSGKLRYSDMIMFDRETESWWQQAIGEGIVGHHTGTQLDMLPGWTESFLEFSQRNPQGMVMDEPKNVRRPYGSNPYLNYDLSEWPFLYRGAPPPNGISPLVRVVRVGDRAWLLDDLRRLGNHTEQGINFSWTAGQVSALDTSSVSEGRDVGTIRVSDASTGAPLVHDLMFAFVFQAFFPEGEWVHLD